MGPIDSEGWAWSGGGRAQTPWIKVGIANERVFGSSRWEHERGLADGVCDFGSHMDGGLKGPGKNWKAGDKDYRLDVGGHFSLLAKSVGE